MIGFACIAWYSRVSIGSVLPLVCAGCKKARKTDGVVNSVCPHAHHSGQIFDYRNYGFILSYLHKKSKKKLGLFVKNVAQIIECIFGEFEAGAHLPTPGVSCVDKPGAIG